MGTAEGVIKGIAEGSGGQDEATGSVARRAAQKAKTPYADLVGKGVVQDAVGWQPIAASAPGLLKVALQRLGHCGMDHEPNIRLVDS